MSKIRSKLKKSNLILGGLKEVTLEEAKSLKNNGIDIVPGQKLCPTCRILVTKKLGESSSDDTEQSQDEQTQELTEIESSFQADLSKTSLNSTLTEINISPVKTHAVSSHLLVPYGKRKIKQARNAMEEKQENIKSKIAQALNVNESDLNSDEELLVVLLNRKQMT